MSATGRHTPRNRLSVLVENRRLKMARSAHAYVRGNNAKSYDWLGSGTGLALPQGPPIWICGDCHLGNLQSVANSKGKIAIQIRDGDRQSGTRSGSPWAIVGHGGARLESTRRVTRALATDNSGYRRDIRLG
jgi:Uncharacterized protein conserved in bacteria (DUF2252)